MRSWRSPCALFQRWEWKTFYECLDIQSLLNSDDKAIVTDMSGYFYEAGNFKVEFDMEMLDQENSWSHPMHNTIYYSRKDNFDDTTLNVGKVEFWEQWTYTNRTGYEVMIANSQFGAVVICDKAESIIYMNIDNCFETDWNNVTGEYATKIMMTKKQLEEVVDQIDFSIEVESVDMDLAREQLEQFQNE